MIRIIVLLLACVCFYSPVVNAYETLQMIRPIATGAAGTGLNSSNRVYRAYTGIPYNVHADARGGHWPYTYALSNAPAGMTIEAGPCTDIGPTNCTAGTINWPSPTGTASNIVVTITDKDGTQVSGTWTVTSSTTIGADGFCFIAPAGNDTTGNGSLATPWATLAKAWTSCGARSILYFRAGTYVTTGMTETDAGSYGKRVSVNEGSRPVIWMGYPGETAILDYAFTGTPVQLFEMTGSNIWIDNLSITNGGSMMINLNTRTNRYGVVIRRVTASNLLDGTNGNNSAFFMWTISVDTPSYFDTVQNSTFTHIVGSATPSGCALKLYSTIDNVIETSTFDDLGVTNEAIVALKDEDVQYTVRANKINMTTNSYQGIGGNMNTSGAGHTGGEIYHNLVTSSGGGALEISSTRISYITTTTIYRNTFLGVVSMGGSTSAHMTSADGPFTFTNNVIVNAGGSGGSCPSRLTCSFIDDYTILSVNANNIQGANDGTIASATTGALVGSSRTTYLGVAGYELAGVLGGSVSIGNVVLSGSAVIQ